MLSVSSLPRATYYYSRSKTNKDLKNTGIIKQIKEIFYEHKQRYGYRRITLDLHNKGFVVNHKKVKRLMSKLNLYACIQKVKYQSYRGELSKICKNILLSKETDKHGKHTYRRLFNTSQCNEKWTTDVSEFKIAAGKLYLSPILDMHNGEIVSCRISRSPNFKQTTDMLQQAFNKYDNLNKLIFHSDQGWQYQMRPYQKILKDRKITQSMSRKGNCLDNAMMESFFGIMKQEMLYGKEHTFSTLDDLERTMYDYIDYYNNKRIKVNLKGLTPVQYRNQSLSITT